MTFDGRILAPELRSRRRGWRGITFAVARSITPEQIASMPTRGMLATVFLGTAICPYAKIAQCWMAQMAALQMATLTNNCRRGGRPVLGEPRMTNKRRLKRRREIVWTTSPIWQSDWLPNLRSLGVDHHRFEAGILGRTFSRATRLPSLRQGPRAAVAQRERGACAVASAPTVLGKKDVLGSVLAHGPPAAGLERVRC